MAKDDNVDATEQTMLHTGSGAVPSFIRIGHYVSWLQDGKPNRVRVKATGVTVGRHPGCDIVLAAPQVSRQHCRIHPEGDGVVLMDLGSTNGTFVGGHRVEQPVRLGNGSQLTVGGFLLRYEQRDERELEEESRLTAELRQAVEYVRAILPEPITDGPVRAAWWYVPSSELGGDAFGFQFLDETTFAGFLIDVSGHGIGAGMHAVNVANTLRRQALPGVDFRDPGQVAAGLNAMFPMEQHGGLILTLWYFAYDLKTRVLRYCAAGHHPAFLLSPASPTPEPVWLRAPSIGMLPRRSWPTGEVAVPHGGRLYVFSDGAFEIEPRGETPWQMEDLRRLIGEGVTEDMHEGHRLYHHVCAAARPGPLPDDFSVLVFHFP